MYSNSHLKIDRNAAVFCISNQSKFSYYTKRQEASMLPFTGNLMGPKLSVMIDGMRIANARNGHDELTMQSGLRGVLASHISGTSFSGHAVAVTFHFPFPAPVGYNDHFSYSNK